MLLMISEVSHCSFQIDENGRQECTRIEKHGRRRLSEYTSHKRRTFDTSFGSTENLGENVGGDGPRRAAPRDQIDGGLAVKTSLAAVQRTSIRGSSKREWHPGLDGGLFQVAKAADRELSIPCAPRGPEDRELREACRHDQGA